MSEPWWDRLYERGTCAHSPSRPGYLDANPHVKADEPLENITLKRNTHSKPVVIQELPREVNRKNYIANELHIRPDMEQDGRAKCADDSVVQYGASRAVPSWQKGNKASEGPQFIKHQLRYSPDFKVLDENLHPTTFDQMESNQTYWIVPEVRGARDTVLHDSHPSLNKARRIPAADSHRNVHKKVIKSKAAVSPITGANWYHTEYEGKRQANTGQSPVASDRPASAGASERPRRTRPDPYDLTDRDVKTEALDRRAATGKKEHVPSRPPWATGDARWEKGGDPEPVPVNFRDRSAWEVSLSQGRHKLFQ